MPDRALLAAADQVSARLAVLLGEAQEADLVLLPKEVRART
jgi:hypothetical protein